MITLNGTEIKPTIFPDGTSQIWKLDTALIIEVKAMSVATIRWDFENEAELFHVCQLAQLIREIDNCEISLFAPYLPYGRQDKPVSNDTTFALITFSLIVENFFDELCTIDAHSSDILSQMTKFEFRSIFPTESIEFALDDTESDLVCYPDHGATERYGESIHLPYMTMDKVRDQSTGEITGLKICEDNPSDLNISDYTDKKVLIVDDLCDGGRTFIEAAKVLYKELSLAEVNLYVSHGIFSQGTEVLIEAGIKNIYTYKGKVR